MGAQAKSMIFVAIAIGFAFYQLSKTYSKSSERHKYAKLEVSRKKKKRRLRVSKLFVKQFEKAIGIIEAHIDPERYGMYYIISTEKLMNGVDPDDPFRSKVIVMKKGQTSPSIAAELIRDRRKVTLSERRKQMKISYHEKKRQSKKKRRNAAKMKQFLIFKTYDAELNFLRELLVEANIIRDLKKKTKSTNDAEIQPETEEHQSPVPSSLDSVAGHARDAL